MESGNLKIELSALVNLLDEPDETAFLKIRDQFFCIGSDAIPFLENARYEAFDPIIRDRVDQIIHQIRLDDITSEFTAWIRTGSSDLLKGFILVSKTDNALLEEDQIYAQIEKIRMDTWLELNDNLTALETVKVLNHILFHVHHFDGNRIYPMAEENFFLPSLLSTHKGSPLSLGMLYLIIAQKLNIPLAGVNLPQHFILAYLSSSENPKPTVDDVQFYLNPMNRGSVFTRKEIELFISQLKIPAHISFFSPCSNIDIIERLLENLISIHDQQKNMDKLKDLEYLKSLIETL